MSPQELRAHLLAAHERGDALGQEAAVRRYAFAQLRAALAALPAWMRRRLSHWRSARRLRA